MNQSNRTIYIENAVHRAYFQIREESHTAKDYINTTIDLFNEISVILNNESLTAHEFLRVCKDALEKKSGGNYGEN